MIKHLDLNNEICSPADTHIEDKVNEVISKVNEMEAKLLSASPTNTGYKYADAHAAETSHFFSIGSQYSLEKHKAFNAGFAAARLIS